MKCRSASSELRILNFLSHAAKSGHSAIAPQM